MVLVASGALAWACGGDDDGSSDNGTTSGGGSGGAGGSGPSSSGGTGGSGGSGGSGASTTSAGGGSGGGSGSGGTVSTSTTTPTTGGSGGTGDAGAAGMAGMAGAAGDAGEPTIEELCEADCAKISQVECFGIDPNTCVDTYCMPFYQPECDAEYRAYLECEAAADVSEFICLDTGYPSVPYDCNDVINAYTNCRS